MRILIVGTLNGQIGAASQIAMKRGATVQQADSVESGLHVLRNGQGADLILIDVSLEITDLIKSLESERIVIPVVACGTGTDTQAAVQAIRAGAKEYLPLPPDAALIAAVFEAIAEEAHTIIHKDPRMAEVLRLANQVAPSDASILITGPSGTGKEMLARYVHSNSKRNGGPFVAVNCAAIPENLLESELFGHEKGAFTGAIARRLGKFEEANGGTLLLDEITEMDPRLQAKLLRTLQEREIDRVGGKSPVKVNVRILATSNRNMEEVVANGSFREDLFFRLNVMNLRIPSLSERPQDVSVLAEYFVTKYAEANGVDERPISNEVMTMLCNHKWPGNVRELENTMHRAVLLASAPEITPDVVMLTNSSDNQPSGAPLINDDETQNLVGRTVAEVERDLIIDTLTHCLGNRTHAANILGISIRTLRNKLKLYGDQGFNVPNPGEAGTGSP